VRSRVVLSGFRASLQGADDPTTSHGHHSARLQIGALSCGWLCTVTLDGTALGFYPYRFCWNMLLFIWGLGASVRQRFRFWEILCSALWSPSPAKGWVRNGQAVQRKRRKSAEYVVRLPCRGRHLLYLCFQLFDLEMKHAGSGFVRFSLYPYLNIAVAFGFWSTLRINPACCCRKWNTR